MIFGLNENSHFRFLVIRELGITGMLNGMHQFRSIWIHELFQPISPLLTIYPSFWLLSSSTIVSHSIPCNYNLYLRYKSLHEYLFPCISALFSFLSIFWILLFWKQQSMQKYYQSSNYAVILVRLETCVSSVGRGWMRNLAWHLGIYIRYNFFIWMHNYLLFFVTMYRMAGRNSEG